jgi:hypothetical protein
MLVLAVKILFSGTVCSISSFLTVLLSEGLALGISVSVAWCIARFFWDGVTDWMAWDALHAAIEGQYMALGSCIFAGVCAVRVHGFCSMLWHQMIWLLWQYV